MVVTNKNQYRPDAVTPPGDTLLEVIEERGMAQSELADRLGLTPKTVNEIVKGKAPMTQDTALALERVLGIPAGFWNRLEAHYREHIARREEEERLTTQQEWLKQFPLSDMIRMKFVEKRSAPVEQIQEVLSFLGIASPIQWNGVASVAQGRCRHTQAFKSDANAIAVWLRQGELMAQRIECKPFDEHGFRRVLLAARGLSKQKQEVFFPELVRLGASCGVAVVFVPAIKGVRACGFTRWLNPIKALLQLSDRYKNADSFWFTFFHEAAHLLLHGKRDAFLEGEKGQEDDKERDADSFAASFLIPPHDYHAMKASNPRSHTEIMEWAERIGISAGIIVGRLQKDGLLPWSHCNDMKVSLDWSKIPKPMEPAATAGRADTSVKNVLTTN